MPEMQQPPITTTTRRQPQFVYSASGPFTKNKERIQKFKETGDTSYIYKAKRTAVGKVLRDKAFKIASDQKYDGYQRGLASMVFKFFDKKSSGSGIINKENMQLADELHKPIIRKFKKRKMHALFRDNIWGVDLADMQLLSKFNKGFRFFYVLLIFLVNMLGLFH